MPPSRLLENTECSLQPATPDWPEQHFTLALPPGSLQLLAPVGGQWWGEQSGPLLAMLAQAMLAVSSS